MRPACVVTGASSGIGAETAVGVARAGYDVALVARDVARMDAVAMRCRDAGAAVRTYRTDFAELAQVRKYATLKNWSIMRSGRANGCLSQRRIPL